MGPTEPLPGAGGVGAVADEIFALAAGIEGRPDNVAACLAGGLTIAWLEDGGPRPSWACPSWACCSS